MATVAAPLNVDVANAEAWTFACLPGCGLCCATSPSVLPTDEARAQSGGLPVVRRADGSLGLALRGPACAVLAGDRACSIYEARPFACRAFPIQLHAFERLQADVHLGCPGIAAVAGSAAATGGEASADALPRTRAVELARRIAEEALSAGALDVDAAARNAETIRDRLRAMGFPEPARVVSLAFEGFDPCDPDTLRGLYVAASDATLAPEDVADAVEEGRKASGVSLSRLLSEVASETPRRDPDHANAATLAWRALDLAKADSPRALGLSAEVRAPLAAHAARLLARDLTWGHALRIVDATAYEVSPAAAYARVFADAGAGLLLRAQAMPDPLEAVASYEWHYWGLPTIGSAL